MRLPTNIVGIEKYFLYLSSKDVCITGSCILVVVQQPLLQATTVLAEAEDICG